MCHEYSKRFEISVLIEKYICINANTIEIAEKLAFLFLLWVALSSISLTCERAPPSSNSLHTIYHVFCFIFLYCITFEY